MPEWMKNPFPDSDCLDINNCRTLGEIIAPCLTALFASIYLSVHLNVPQPSGLGWFRQALTFANICIVALLFPEWVFSWAVRSFVVAYRVRGELESARKQAVEKWYQAPRQIIRPSACESNPYTYILSMILATLLVRTANRSNFDPNEGNAFKIH